MNRVQLEDTLAASTLVGGGLEHGDVFDTVCGCDMMSELLSIMNNSHEPPKNVLLLTNLANLQVVRTCEMVDIQVVVFMRNRTPDSETIQMARNCEIILMTTPYSMFKSCGLLYEMEMNDVKEEIRRV